MKKEPVQFSNLVSREERHYCAFLFAWFLMDKNNMKIYFENHNKPIFREIGNVHFQSCQIFYEYTAIRELIYFFKKVKKDDGKASLIKAEAEKVIFNGGKGDVQKKKADFAFYFPEEKTLILTEAKFEMNNDENQFVQTEEYGKFLMKEFPNDIKEVKLILLGTEFYNEKYPKLSSISWENLTNIIDNVSIKSEIIKGLNYQKVIHKRAMKNWVCK